jgi:hypothetical protein
MCAYVCANVFMCVCTSLSLCVCVYLSVYVCGAQMDSRCGMGLTMAPMCAAGDDEDENDDPFANKPTPAAVPPATEEVNVAAPPPVRTCAPPLLSPWGCFLIVSAHANGVYMVSAHVCVPLSLSLCSGRRGRLGCGWFQRRRHGRWYARTHREGSDTGMQRHTYRRFCTHTHRQTPTHPHTHASVILLHRERSRIRLHAQTERHA